MPTKKKKARSGKAPPPKASSPKKKVRKPSVKSKSGKFNFGGLKKKVFKDNPKFLRAYSC